MGLLDKKVAIITGAGGGLGEAYARLFAKEGASVVVNDLGGPRDGSGKDATMAQKIAASIVEGGGKAIANGSDVSTMDGGETLFNDAIKAFGKVDILVNNAGILRDGTFAKMTETQWDSVIKVHLKGTFCATLPVFEYMKDHGGGVIVNTSSGSGLIGNFGQTNYGAAKAGIAGFTRVLSIEGRKYNIRVWTLSPGALTRMTEDLQERRGASYAPWPPEMIAPGVLYMVSDLSGDQTNKIMTVSSNRGIREMKIFMAEGWTPTGPYTAQDVAANASKVFFRDDAKAQ
jgi:NAD(P)-dependent dehydrogenase (short-subunit alcohol dehydrogenase family)